MSADAPVHCGVSSVGQTCRQAVHFTTLDEREIRLRGVAKPGHLRRKPAVSGLKRIEMLTLLGDLVFTLDETSLPLNAFTGFRVWVYMDKGGITRLAANTFQMYIMVDAIMVVRGNGVESKDGVDWIAMQKDSLLRGINGARIH